MKSIGITDGAPCAENGPTTQAALVQNLREHIRNLTPFECDDWDALCSAIIYEYDADTWKSKLIWVLGCVRKTKQWAGTKGSYNVPLKSLYDDDGEREAYKVFRRFQELKNNIFMKEYAYEYHPKWVQPNQWLQAELSGSPDLTGLTPKEQGGTGGRFHTILDKAQAVRYLNTVASNHWLPPQWAEIRPVKTRKCQTMDLVYIPPKTFVWGIDASEMYVEL